jgi:hypothetical protein
MAYALNKDLNGPLRTLVSVDMSPAVGKISPEYVSQPLLKGTFGADCRFASYAESMLDVEKANVKTKAEADKILQKVEPVRPFHPSHDLYIV